MQQRLQKIIAAAGIASRRAAETLITDGHVRVNGQVITELGAKANPRIDKIEVRGKRLVTEAPYYLVMHKPRDVVSTLSDPEGRPTVADLLKPVGHRLYPVGRLDYATSGVLLFTNDGDFANGLLHPRQKVPKTYAVKVLGQMSEHDLDVWRNGVMLEDGKTAPAKAKLLRLEGDKTWLELTIHEGRNQQIRRMGQTTGFRVMRLSRLSFAGITHDGLRPGAYRSLTSQELTKLRETYGVPRKVKAAQKVDDSKPVPNRRMVAKAAGAKTAAKADRPASRAAEAGGPKTSATSGESSRSRPPRDTAQSSRTRSRGPGAGGSRSKDAAPPERRRARPTQK